MNRTLGNYDGKFAAWRVDYDFSDLRTGAEKQRDRLQITGGLLSLGTKALSTSEVSTGTSLNISRRTAYESSQHPNLYLDMQKNKWLYAKITLSNYSVTLEYSSSAPYGNGAITLLNSTTQRIPLAFITSDGVIIDSRPVGGGGGSTTTYDPFETYSPSSSTLKVAAGTIIWNDKLISVAASDTITISGSYVTYYVWLSLDDEFSPSTPSVTINSGLSSWSGYPNQPTPPARRHWLLATPYLIGNAVYSLNVQWKGNIAWTSTYGFWY